MSHVMSDDDFVLSVLSEPYIADAAGEMEQKK